MTVILVIAWFVEQTLMPTDSGLNGYTIGEHIEHLKDYYPVFWDTVFADLHDGLEWLRRSASLFWWCCIFLTTYCCCNMCWRPYSPEAWERNGKVTDYSLEGEAVDEKVETVELPGTDSSPVIHSAEKVDAAEACTADSQKSQADGNPC